MANPFDEDFLQTIVAVHWGTPSPPQTGRDWVIVSMRANDIPSDGPKMNHRFTLNGQSFQLMTNNNPMPGAVPNPHKIVKGDLSKKLLPFSDLVGFRQTTNAVFDGHPTFKTVSLAFAIVPSLFATSIEIQGFVRCSKHLDGAAAIVVTTISRNDFKVNNILDIDQTGFINSPGSVGVGFELMAYESTEQASTVITVDPTDLSVNAP